MSNTRVLNRLIERLEEFVDEYKLMLEVDEAVTLDDAISVIDRVKTELEEESEISDEEND
jgi:DNA integrity scanning protein DisA with diadenylate cyclase activity